MIFNFIFDSIFSGCDGDDYCSSNETCKDQDCINPCEIPKKPCSNPATCFVSNRQPICRCPPDYDKNTDGQCIEGMY